MPHYILRNKRNNVRDIVNETNSKATPSGRRRHVNIIQSPGIFKF